VASQAVFSLNWRHFFTIEVCRSRRDIVIGQCRPGK
jgi:hypothetical protein